MGTALVATRNKEHIARRQFFQRFDDVIAFGLGWIGGWANQHKVVVHNGKAFDGKAFGHDLLFGDLIMHKQDVGVAAAPHVDGLAGAQRHHLDLDATGLFEFRQQVGKQTRLLGRGGRRHNDRLRLSGHTGDKQRSCQYGLQNLHTSSPLTNKWAAGYCSCNKGPLKKSATGKSASKRPCSR